MYRWCWVNASNECQGKQTIYLFIVITLKYYLHLFQFLYHLNNEKSTFIILMSVVFSKHAAVLVLDKELMTESLYQVTWPGYLQRPTFTHSSEKWGSLTHSQLHISRILVKLSKHNLTHSKIILRGHDMEFYLNYFYMFLEFYL